MSALGINAGALISQVIVFVVLLAVLWKFAFPILGKTLDQRQARIQEGIDNAERAKRELASAEKRIEAMLNEARLESQKVHRFRDHRRRASEGGHRDAGAAARSRDRDAGRHAHRATGGAGESRAAPAGR